MPHLPDLQDFSATLSTFLQENVGLWSVDEADWNDVVEACASFKQLELMDHHGDPIVDTPMSAAPFTYRDDGRPDWGEMWQGFCELALYGGPPHRGAGAALETPVAAPGEVVEDAMIAETVRGIAETTGLTAVPAAGGWLSVECGSKRMAAWLSAVIILENVDARAEGALLFVPGGHGFELKDQVKSVITVVAKSFHYWQEHIANEAAGGESAPRAAARRVLQGDIINRLKKAS